MDKINRLSQRDERLAVRSLAPCQSKSRIHALVRIFMLVVFKLACARASRFSRLSHSRLLSRAALAWLFRTLPNGKHGRTKLDLSCYDARKISRWNVSISFNIFKSLNLHFQLIRFPSKHDTVAHCTLLLCIQLRSVFSFLFPFFVRQRRSRKWNMLRGREETFLSDFISVISRREEIAWLYFLS